MTRAQASPWNVVGVLSPMLVIVTVGAWRSGHRWVGAAAALSLAALCVQALRGRAGVVACALPGAARRHQLLPRAGLRQHAAPRPHAADHRRWRCACMAGTCRRAMPLYTRTLTLAWVIFFVAIVAVSLALYAFAQLRHLGAVRQPADADRHRRDVRRRVPAALPAAPGVRARRPRPTRCAPTCTAAKARGRRSAPHERARR